MTRMRIKEYKVSGRAAIVQVQLLESLQQSVTRTRRTDSENFVTKFLTLMYHLKAY
jgi:hypothetical protein